MNNTDIDINNTDLYDYVLEQDHLSENQLPNEMTEKQENFGNLRIPKFNCKNIILLIGIIVILYLLISECSQKQSAYNSDIMYRPYFSRDI